MRTALLLALLSAAPRGDVERTVDVTRDVVILVNENVPESVAIGEYYALKRGIPRAQICRVKTSANEVFTWPELRREILEPLKKFLESRPEVLYIVPTYGIPVKVSEEKAGNEPKGDKLNTLQQCVEGRDYGAIDREIELLKQDHELDGWLPSKTFNQDRHITRDDGIYIVSRLDGPTADEAKALVDLALYGEAYGVEGEMFIDTRGLNSPGDGYTECDQTMKLCAKVCEKYGIKYTHDDKPEVVDLATLKNVSHYWAWYTGNVVCSKDEWRFNRGAIGAHLHSFSAGNFRKKESTWTGPLVHHGLACTWGTVYEPLISGFPFGTTLFDRFFQGYTFGESIQMASQMTSWVALFVGDPLYAPHAKGMKERQEKNRALAREAFASIAAALDAGDAAKADEVARQVAAIGVPYAGADDVGFLVREMKARAAWPDRKAKGTVADLKRAVDASAAAADPKQALALAQKALEISPANVEANLIAARASIETGAGRSAIAFVEIAAKVEATFETHYWMGRALRAAGRGRESIPEFEAALAIRTDIDALRNLGEVYIEEKKYAEAIKRLEAACARFPNEREIAGELGKAYLATKDFKKAIATFENALKDLPATWADVRDYVTCTELLLSAAKSDGIDKPRIAALTELVKDLRSSKVKATSKSAAAKIDDYVDETLSAATSEKLGDIPAYDDKLPGCPKIRFAGKAPNDLFVYISGPMSSQLTLKAYSGKGAERTVDVDLVPGVYRVVINVVQQGRTKSYTKELRVEPGKWYGFGLDDKFKVYRPPKS